MANKSVTVTLVNQGADIEATYSDDITTVTVTTSFTWDGSKPFTVEQLRDAPARLAMHLLKQLTPPLESEQSQ
jgi:hypothetical protein